MEDIHKRSKAEIDYEYTACATQVGDLEFKIRVCQNALIHLYEKMDILNREAADFETNRAKAESDIQNETPEHAIS